ncbi:MAG: hypothetical protein QXG39_01385 [Candidatus Aenigmatarchaeota archaeon]
MVEETEIISIMYGLLKGLKAYREAYNELNNNKEETNDVSLEEIVKRYKQIEELLSIIGKVFR